MEKFYGDRDHKNFDYLKFAEGFVFQFSRTLQYVVMQLRPQVVFKNTIICELRLLYLFCYFTSTSVSLSVNRCRECKK